MRRKILENIFQEKKKFPAQKFNHHFVSGQSKNYQFFFFKQILNSIAVPEVDDICWAVGGNIQKNSYPFKNHKSFFLKKIFNSMPVLEVDNICQAVITKKTSYPFFLKVPKKKTYPLKFYKKI
jgi:hypothetical protein